MNSALEEQLIFYGGGGEQLFFGGDGTEPTSPEERIKSLLGEDRGLMRRRIVRRPLGGASASQLLSFTERDGDASSLSVGGGDPLSELLSHLAASRKAAGEPPSLMRGSCDGRDPTSATGASPLSALALWLAALPNEPSAHQPGAPTAAEREQRSSFVQQLMLGSLTYPLHSPSPADADVTARTACGASSDRWPLDAPASKAMQGFAVWLKGVCGVGQVYAAALTADGLDSLPAICAAVDESDWPQLVKRGHRKLIRAEAAAAIQRDPGLGVGRFPNLVGGT